MGGRDVKRGWRGRLPRAVGHLPLGTVAEIVATTCLDGLGRGVGRRGPVRFNRKNSASTVPWVRGSITEHFTRIHFCAWLWMFPRPAQRTTCFDQ